MSADSTKATKIQRNNQGDLLTVASGGKLEVLAGATIEVSGDATITGMVPKPPAGDGDYVLHIASGVATWVAAE